MDQNDPYPKKRDMTPPAPFPNLSVGRVLVVGDVMLDRYWHGHVHRISPEAPVPVVGVQHDEVRLGGAANVASNITALTGRAHLLGLIGHDQNGAMLEGLLQAQDIGNALQRVAGQGTITKLRVLARKQQLIRLDFEQAFDPTEGARLSADLHRLLPEVDVVVFSDYAKGTLQDCTPWLHAAKAEGKTTIVDPKGTDFKRYRGADIITPNLSEFEAVVGPCPNLQTLELRAQALCTAHNFQSVLVTRGEKGMSLVMGHQGTLHLPTQAQEVFDVTGAGDTVVATLALALASGCPLPMAVELSNLAAGLAVGRVGTSRIPLAELEQVWRSKNPASHDPHGARSPLCNLSQLLALRAQARSQGQRVVMTNGCFDVLHPGHIACLEQARALGDLLVVAVNDDASVRRLKGPSRPINTLADRLHMLGALSCVDWVIAFGEDTPETLITQVQPDVLVKGGDYTSDQIAGAASVLASGGQVRVLDFVPGYSSTAVIQRIAEEQRGKP